jgi:hypothetical protein
VRARQALVGVLLIALLIGLAAPVSSASPVRSMTIDIDATGAWIGFFRMDPLFFKSDGIQFAGEYMVGFSVGEAVLEANAAWNDPPYTIAATFTRPVDSVSASIRMNVQGTAQYTLVAYSPSGDVIGSSTITMTQNGLDPNFHDVTVDDLPSKAKSFSLVGGIDYEVRSISYRYGQ